MKVTVHGTGYVGLVSGACLAETGNQVLCVDVDERKVDALKAGEIPIFEPGLSAIVKRNVAKSRLNFTTDVAAGVAHGDIQFIAVGTPPDEDGSADMQYVLAVAKTIGSYMDDYKVVVNKSTVPVGTAARVRDVIAETLETRGANIDFDVVSNPEFLKEGAAVSDFMKPDRIIIGTNSERARARLVKLYEPFNRNHIRMIVMDERSAELTKYAANAMLATKISFMNEMSNLAERLGADIESVRIGIGSDPRIGYEFIYPGAGYGGSCFPKDVRALESLGKSVNYDAELIRAVESVNNRQKNVLAQKVRQYFGGSMAGKTLALWGLSFKPNTDDMREAPSLDFIKACLKDGAVVRAYDPEARDETRRIFGDSEGLQICSTAEGALQGADALVIMTEWREFRSPDFDLIKERLNQPVIFDGRNLYDPASVKAEGLEYFAIGRRSA
jgi:UDPglucose 6-dehydrogenase